LLPIIIIYYHSDATSKIYAAIYVISIHTLFYLFNSTWLVGYREVNKKFKGKGIQSIVDFSNYVKEDIKHCDNNAVLLYGSLPRKKYHNRSDLDIRIIRSSNDNVKLFFKAIKYRAVGIWKYKIPVDLKVVDSMDYLKKEMRDDEHPIIISKKENFEVYNEGVPFESLEKSPSDFIK
jgi:predicted nucleotidyltransferase